MCQHPRAISRLVPIGGEEICEYCVAGNTDPTQQKKWCILRMHEEHRIQFINDETGDEFDWNCEPHRTDREPDAPATRKSGPRARETAQRGLEELRDLFLRDAPPELPFPPGPMSRQLLETQEAVHPAYWKLIQKWLAAM